MSKPPRPWPTSISTRPLLIAQAKLGGAFKEAKLHTVMVMMLRTTKAIMTPIIENTSTSKSVAKLKWDGTPRHVCIVINAVSITAETPKVPITSHPAKGLLGRKESTQASDQAMKAKENEKEMGLRQDRGPSHGPRSTRNTPA